jgi:hypothetical protein
LDAVALDAGVDQDARPEQLQEREHQIGHSAPLSGDGVKQEVDDDPDDQADEQGTPRHD